MYSVLDKVVPGYYHRLETNGSVCGSAFGANNAPEHAMMERLVIDDLCHWAIQYKVSLSLSLSLSLHSNTPATRYFSIITIPRSCDHSGGSVASPMPTDELGASDNGNTRALF
jgi:hypothetical protein